MIASIANRYSCRVETFRLEEQCYIGSCRLIRQVAAPCNERSARRGLMGVAALVWLVEQRKHGGRISDKRISAATLFLANT